MEKPTAQNKRHMSARLPGYPDAEKIVWKDFGVGALQAGGLFIAVWVVYQVVGHLLYW